MFVSDGKTCPFLMSNHYLLNLITGRRFYGATLLLPALHFKLLQYARD